MVSRFISKEEQKYTASERLERYIKTHKNDKNVINFLQTLQDRMYPKQLMESLDVVRKSIVYNIPPSLDVSLMHHKLKNIKHRPTNHRSTNYEQHRNDKELRRLVKMAIEEHDKKHKNTPRDNHEYKTFILDKRSYLSLKTNPDFYYKIADKRRVKLLTTLTDECIATKDLCLRVGYKNCKVLYGVKNSINSSVKLHCKISDNLIETTRGQGMSINQKYRVMVVR